MVISPDIHITSKMSDSVRPLTHPRFLSVILVLLHSTVDCHSYGLPQELPFYFVLKKAFSVN